MTYNIKIDVFEGPFDLLLYLVKVNEMDIYDISIATITNEYLEYIKGMEELDLKVTGDFLVLAATLIHLKSRTLMPPPVDEEEEEEELDEEFENIRSAQDLMRRLVEYREFKELGLSLAEREEEQLRLFYRNTVLPVLTDDSENREMKEDLTLLFGAFARVLDFAEGLRAHHVAAEEFSVEEKIESIKNQVALAGRLSLHQLVQRCINKAEIITVFLALLEICRQRLIRIRQRRNFGDIYLLSPSEPDDEDEE